MNTAEIRNYLMRAPRPSMVRVVTKDAVHDLEVETDQNWARLAESVEALDPVRIELYSEQQQLLRAEKYRQRVGAQVEAPQGLANDAETLRTITFANLVHRAYEHSTDVAFDRLVQMFERQGDQVNRLMTRLEATETRYFDLLNEYLNLANDSGGGDDDENPLAGLARAFAGGAEQAAQETKTKKAAKATTEEQEKVE